MLPTELYLTTGTECVWTRSVSPGNFAATLRAAREARAEWLRAHGGGLYLVLSAEGAVPGQRVGVVLDSEGGGLAVQLSPESEYRVDVPTRWSEAVQRADIYLGRPETWATPLASWTGVEARKTATHCVREMCRAALGAVLAAVGLSLDDVIVLAGEG